MTIFGGVNDYLQNCDIGTTNDTEDTTFYGACKKLIEKIKNKFAQAEIIWIIPLNMTMVHLILTQMELIMLVTHWTIIELLLKTYVLLTILK